MDASCGRTDAGNGSKLGASAGVAIHQGIEDAGAGRLADRGGNFRGGGIGVRRYMHCLMVDEVLMQDNENSSGNGSS